MKKNISLSLIVAVLLCFGSMANATGVDVKPLAGIADMDVGALSAQQVTAYSNEIAQMSDDEFDQFISDLTVSSANKDELTETLGQLGVEVSFPEPTITPFYTGSQYANISCSAARRSGEAYFHLITSFNLRVGESFHGSEDIVIAYFDASSADYYSTNCGAFTSFREGRYATSGTVAFNFYDEDAWTSATYVAVYVTPKSSASIINYGADWTHTYTSVVVTGSVSATVNYGGQGGVNGSMGASVTVSPNQGAWMRAATNAVTSY